MPNIIEYPDELTHYGRLGMKWGQHIFGKESSTSRSTKERRSPNEYEKKTYFEKSKKALNPPYRVSKEGREYREKMIKPMYEKSAKHIQKLIKKEEPSKLLKQIKKEYWNEDEGGDPFKRLCDELDTYMLSNAPEGNESYYLPYKSGSKRVMERITLGKVYSALWSSISQEGSRNYWDEVLDFKNPDNVEWLLEEVDTYARFH